MTAGPPLRSGPLAIHVVTDRRRLAPAARTRADEITALVRFLEEAVVADVDVVHVREPDLPARVLADVVSRAVSGARAGLRVIVNERADVACAAGAHGVHLKATGPPAGRVRRLAGGRDAWIVGRSVHGVDEARAAGDVDYLYCGTVFATASKPAGTVWAGVERLRQLVTAVAVPVVAIGGISSEGAESCAAAGAAGVAAIGLFLPEGRASGARGLARAAAELRAAIARGAGRR